MNIIAPRPQKPSSSRHTKNVWTEEDEACRELQQILASHSNRMEDFAITRTNNPLPNDTSFVPLHQAVSHLSVSDSRVIRPRSFSVGDTRNYTFNANINLVH